MTSKQPSKKRATQDEPIYLDDSLLTELDKAIEKTKWPYKTKTEQLWLRDQACGSMFILTGFRNSEVGQGPQTTWGKRLNPETNKREYYKYTPNSYPLKRKEIRIYPDKLLIPTHQTVKKGNTRKNLELPKTGGFAPLVQRVENYLNLIDDQGIMPEQYLFPSANNQGNFRFDYPMSTKRIYWIIKTTTGLFAHYYRAVNETIFGRKVFKNDAWKLMRYMGLRRLDSTSPYVQSEWEENKPEIYKL